MKSIYTYNLQNENCCSLSALLQALTQDLSPNTPPIGDSMQHYFPLCLYTISFNILSASRMTHVENDKIKHYSMCAHHGFFSHIETVIVFLPICCI